MYTAIDDKEVQLSSGKLVIAEVLEYEIRKICHYVHHVVLALKDGQFLVAMIFPNRALFRSPDYEKTPEEGCFCPRNLGELGKCLSGCMQSINARLSVNYAKINAAVIIEKDLSVADETLTTDSKTNPGNVIMKYRRYLDGLFDGKETVTHEVYYMKLNE